MFNSSIEFSIDLSTLNIPSPGPELDAFIAEKLMGHKVMRDFKDYCRYVLETDHQPFMNSGYPCMIIFTASNSSYIPQYSTNDTIAMQEVVRKLGDLGYVITLKYDGKRSLNRWTMLEANHPRLGPDRDSLAQVICEGAYVLMSNRQ